MHWVPATLFYCILNPAGVTKCDSVEAEKTVTLPTEAICRTAAHQVATKMLANLNAPVVFIHATCEQQVET